MNIIKDDKTTKQSFYYTLGIVSFLFSNWAVLNVLPRFESMEFSGYFSLILSISDICYVFTSFSVHDFQVIASYDEIPEKDFFTTRFYTYLFSLVVCVFILFLQHGDSSFFFVSFVYVVFHCLNGFSDVFFASLQKKKQLDIAGKIMLMAAISRLFVFSVIYFFTRKPYTSVIVMVISGGIVQNGFSVVLYKSIFNKDFPLQLKINNNIGKILRLCMPLFISQLCPIVITAIPKFLIKEFISAEQLGIYSVLTSVCALVPTMIPFIFAPFVSEMAQIYNNDRTSLFRWLIEKIFYIFCFFVLYMVGYFLIGSRIFSIYYRMDMTNYNLLISLYLISLLCLTLGNFVIPVFIVAAKNRLVLLAIALSLFICISSSSFFIINFGINGAGISLLVSYLIYMCIMLFNCYFNILR